MSGNLSRFGIHGTWRSGFSGGLDPLGKNIQQSIYSKQKPQPPPLPVPPPPAVPATPDQVQVLQAGNDLRKAALKKMGYQNSIFAGATGGWMPSLGLVATGGTQKLGG